MTNTELVVSLQSRVFKHYSWAEHQQLLHPMVLWKARNDCSGDTELELPNSRHESIRQLEIDANTIQWIQNSTIDKLGVVFEMKTTM